MTVSSKYVLKAVWAYPIIFFISWAPTFFSTAYSIINEGQSFVLFLIHTGFSHSQGFFDAMYFICIGMKRDSDGAESARESIEVDGIEIS